jgi:hypothetical protein
VDHDPCTEGVWWSAIKAATGDLTLSGVLAGLLIAAAAALLVAWYELSAPPTIALFGSGVPALALSTFLFTVIAGMDFPNPTRDKKVEQDVCSQLWSQWLLAIGLLFVGAAVLVCGLGWALVGYSDNLAVRLCKSNIPIGTVESSRMNFIRLNGWISGGVITTTIALLISSNVTYVKTIHKDTFGSPFSFSLFSIKLFSIEGSFSTKWYAILFVFLIGIYFMSRSAYIAANRTRSAQRANKRLCAAYATVGLPGVTDNERIKDAFAVAQPRRSPSAKYPRSARNKKVAMRAAQEFAVVLWVALGALVAAHMTSTSLKPPPDEGWAPPSHYHIVRYVVVVYIIARVTYALIVGIVKLVSAKKEDTSTNEEAVPPANVESVERIRITYSVGMLAATTRNVVLMAIFAAFFVVALTQGPLSTHPITQVIISLFLGGVYPAAILTGLSYSIPAGEDGRLPPKWVTVRGLALLIPPSVWSATAASSTRDLGRTTTPPVS